jgi:hypothetical protein
LCNKILQDYGTAKADIVNLSAWLFCETEHRRLLRDQLRARDEPDPIGWVDSSVIATPL